ncbi:MAG: putative RNA uridine N3 methyltransferase [Acidilobaceae archaeon]
MSYFKWPPPKRRKKLIIAFPGSVLVTEDTLELKTIKAGLLGRSLAIFRVNEALLFRDSDTTIRDLKLLRLLLKYMVTPPHIRRKAYPITSDLSAVGLLPPLRLYPHDIPQNVEVGVKIDGYVESCSGGECKVYLGRIGYGILRDYVKPGSIVTVEVKSIVNSKIILQVSSWGDIYTGFRVKVIYKLEDIINYYKSRSHTIILSSKYGEWIGNIANNIFAHLSGSRGALIIFGGPYKCPYEYTSSDLYDFIINTIPSQGTISVRTEEALIATLSALENLSVLS